MGMALDAGTDIFDKIGPPKEYITTRFQFCLIGIKIVRFTYLTKDFYMKVISHGSLEEELKKVLSNPHTSNNLEKAVQIAEEIIKIDKTSNYANYAMGLHELALANRTAPQVDYDRPVEAFKKIIKMDPNFIEPYLMLAKIYRETDRNLEYKLLLKANKQFPDHYLIMFDLANLMTFKTGEKQKGLELFAKCVQKLPMVDSAWSGLGSAYLLNREFDMAQKSFETSLAINPENTTSILGIGVIHFENANFKEARKYYEKSISIDKASFWGNYNIALLNLLEGDDETGWESYEKRNKNQFLNEYGGSAIQEIFKKDISKNSNQKIVILREQGVGDDIMFSRYLRPLKNLGYDVTYACPPDLKGFLRLSPDLDDVKLTSEIADTKVFDYRAFLMSLPWLMSGVQKPRLKDPIKIDLSRLKEKDLKIKTSMKKLFNSKKLKIGLAWSGSPKHLRDFCRSIDIDLLKNIFEIPNVEFFALQKVHKENDIKFIKKFKNVHDCTDHLKDFVYTAYFVKKMDMIFTVDTSLVHMAGTMNKKTFLFLPKVPDYRWGLKNKQEWYPSVSLLRQEKVSDWKKPIEDCQKIINACLSSSS